MAAILETSKGDIVIDLFVDECPKACENFLKLCKLKYYNNALFYNVQRNFIAQTGDPTGTGRGGESVWGVLYGDQARFFDDEIRPPLKHKKRGMVGMASAGPNLNASQFYITTGDNLDSLDERHTLFGEVAEGLEVLEAINDAPVDDAGRPLQNIRIRHTIVLDDPFPDPPVLAERLPDASPPPVFADDGRLEDDWVPDEDGRAPEEIEAANREKEARSRAVVLEMIGDLPEADAAPPDNVLFVCKLNPVTTEEDLEIIFSRFGALTSCDIIRDWKTGDSLCYAFVGFEAREACETAYFKMNNVLIDDRRIKVDFSQSVHHLWKQFRRHGTRGDAGLRREADGHERGGGGGGGGLQLKEGLRKDYGGGGYGLVMDEGAEERRSGGREGDQSRERERDKEREMERDRRRRRSRSRSRERRRDRDRRDRDRRRSRSRSRERRRHDDDRDRSRRSRSRDRRRRDDDRDRRRR